MKKQLALGFIFMILVSSVGAKGKGIYNKKSAVTDTGSKEFKETSAIELVKNMKTGWNLGNTFDATGSISISSEISWGQPKTTKAMIDAIADSGMKTLRIPVSWSNHIIDDKFTIDPDWMNRVKEVVDWAISDDMYVILNCHHDTDKVNGYYPDQENYSQSQRFIENVWAQIALAFNNGYDEHLVFEVMNEPRLRGTAEEWGYNSKSEACREAAKYIKKLSETALSAIRASGGNNKNRFVMVPSYVAAPNAALAEEFELPKDSSKGRLILSVHMYTPYIFAGESPGVSKFNQRIQNEFAGTFKRLNDKFVVNGIPVVIGEYGAVNKNNLEDRVMWFSAFIKISRRYGISSILWDNGNWRVQNNNYSELYGYFNRIRLEWYFPEILEAIMTECQE